ncbi:MAG: PKD domain-containing protein [Bacteroidota bacterium]
MSKFYSGVVFILGIISSQIAFSQRIVETQWYFGNSDQHFIFDKNGRDPEQFDFQNPTFGIGGSGVVSDQFTGNLKYYSDGQRIYDGEHQLLPAIAGGTTLNGNPSINQPVVTCPFPDGSPRYYFFTNPGTTGPNEIQYSVVDASILGNSGVAQYPLGDLTQANQGTGLIDPSEAMILLENPTGDIFWLITQNRITFDFQVTEINSTGIGAIQNFNFVTITVPGFEASAFAYDDNSQTLAVASRAANRNIQLLNFNPATGVLSFNQRVLNTGFPDSGTDVVYDLEWSADGTKLYLSRNGDGTNPGVLYQFDTQDTLAAVNNILPYTFNRSWGLKRGLDDKIYHLYQLNNGGPFRLGRVDFADSVAALTVYDSLVFDEDYNGRQFPAFAPGYLPMFDTLNFTYYDSCFTSATKFVPIVSPLPTTFFWDFGDGTTSTATSPVYEYQAAGGNFVSLTVELNGRRQTISKPVDILDTAYTVDLGNDTTICVDETLMLDAGSGATRYVWSTGETTPTITIDTAGTYWVEAYGANGCPVVDEIIVTEYGVASQVYNQWYFGEFAGIDFNEMPPLPLTDANMMFSPEGCATISDIGGQLLFYTDGVTVWNKEHNVMLGGTSIGGENSAAQSAMIIPFADDATLYWIFTTEEVYGDFEYQLKYSIVDLKGDTARGEVITKNNILIKESTERITATGFTANSLVIAHEFGNNVFRGYQIIPEGISAAIYSVAGENDTYQDQLTGRGYMKVSPAAGIIATASGSIGGNGVEICDFDFATGVVTNGRMIDIGEPPANQAYGVEVSATGNRLYVSTIGGGSKLMQFDLDSLGRPTEISDIENSKFDYGGAGGTLGALQIGPDGIIYGAIDNSPDLLTINTPDGDDNGAAVVAAGFNLAGRISRLGLPNFVQFQGSSPPPPGMTVTTACVGQPTIFSAAGRDPSIETYAWDFGDGSGTDFTADPDTVHTYTNDTTYIVTLTLRNRCDVDSIFIDTIQVYTIPELPMVPSDTALCGASLTLNAWDVDRPDLRYYWSTGDTTRSVTFTTPTIVDVAISNTDGCASDTVTVFIGDGRPNLELGADRNFCQRDTVPDLDVGNAGADFTWYIDGIEVGTNQTQPVNTFTAGTFLYKVEIIDPFSGCLGEDSVTITIQPEATITLNSITPSSCGNADGSIDFSLNTAGTFTYDLIGPVTQGPYAFDGPGTPPLLTGLSSGTYSLNVTNTVTGCTSVNVVQVEDNAPFDMDALAINRCSSDAEISIGFRNVVPGAVDINVVNSSGISVFSQSSVSTSTNIFVSNLDTGAYFVEAREINPPFCLQTDSVYLMVSSECLLTIFAPNAFSPNGNAMNEEFYVFPNDFVETFEIYIYNRWGQLIFRSEDKDFRWDGYFGDSLSPPGTYAYIMKFTSSLAPGEEQEQYGSITLIR